MLAGLAEIGGGYLVWLWLRAHRPWWVGLAGAVLLMLYGVLPTLQPSELPFGRVYAAYGGIFVLLSILWGQWIDGVRPDRWDWIGGLIVLMGIGVMLWAPRR